MFDVGFSEILVIAVVVLIVLGPDNLPKVARTCGMLYGRLQRYLSGFKQDMERELALDNMRKATAEAQQKLLAMQSQLSEIHPESAGLAEFELVSQASSEIKTEK